LEISLTAVESMIKTAENGAPQGLSKLWKPK